MFVAWHDLRFARGRFALIAAVVALITLLVGFLSGLTAGLASQNVSAILNLPGDHLVLKQPAQGQPNFSNSSISATTASDWQNAPNVTSSVPIGITQSRVDSGNGQPVAVALFGAPAQTSTSSPVTDLAPMRDNEIGLSSAASKQLDATTGSAIKINGATYQVASVGADLWYSHTPVIVMSPTAWSSADRTMGGTGEATLLAVSGNPDWNSIASSTETAAFTPLMSLTALETFKSEVGSLGLMIAMLFGISALVIGAFFTVWTMQRSSDIAVLKALGASTPSLIRDALGQAITILAIGIGIGLLAVVGFGLLASATVPFLLSPLTTLAPAIVMVVLGLAGAAVALRTVVSSDPLTALGSNR